MIDWDSSDKNVAYWESKLFLEKHWSDLSKDQRKELVSNLQKAIIDIAKLFISQEDLLGLIRLYEHSLIFESALLLVSSTANADMNEYEAFSYLNKIIINRWRDRHPIKERLTWQRKPKEEKEIIPASDETVQKWQPYNFLKRRCSGCNKVIRKDNATGLCAKCQRNGVKSSTK